MEEIIEMLKQKARDSWPGKIGEDRAVKLEEFLRKMLAEYSEKLGFDQEEILSALEARRTYSAINFYQEAEFPSLEGVTVYESQDALMAAIPVKEFRCPNCNGISTNPYECNSGEVIPGGKFCDWKSYGLFGTFGKGFSFTIKESFLEKPMIDQIFMPLCMETQAAAAE